MKNYTQEWNTQFKKNVSNLGKFNLCLEIGCFEGMTSNYIVENLLEDGGSLICVDPLDDLYLKDISILNQTENFFVGQYERFLENTKEYFGNKIYLFRDISTNVYNTLKTDFSNKFSFIYIDGDHRPETVYLDAMNCFELCSTDGYILFDDFKWKDTFLGIDKFLTEKKNLFVELIRNDQLLIKKL